ncbi:MAG: serine hydrolase [Litorilinea sp.]|nr:MAG: serine hydrolase [Litorilinea sp.]
MAIADVVAPERVGFSAQRLARVSRLLDRYVERGRLAGALNLVYRRGQVAQFSTHGYQDKEAGIPMAEDTIFRIYSMTKPITTVAALMLFEDGHFLLEDPIAKYLPEFESVQVYAGSRTNGFRLVPPERPPTIQDLMRHTSGLSYGWYQDSPVDELYRQTLPNRMEGSLAELVEKLAELPLLFHPGTAWRYSFATDVLGRLVEVVSGEALDTFFHQHIFKPLGMEDTGFYVPEEKHHRLAVLYSVLEGMGLGVDVARLPSDLPLKPLDGPQQDRYRRPPSMLSGGGGLVSTIGDYLRFCQMLLNGGVLDGVRLLGRKTVELMTLNHLPPALIPIGTDVAPQHGYGFGLGVSVLVDVAASAAPGSPGAYGWGGAAATRFWIDPQEDLIIVFMTQIMPSSYYPVQREVRTAVYQALVE